ncbi:AraC-like ligand-binding domain-containing protein [Streptomyces sp. YJ-C3]
MSLVVTTDSLPGPERLGHWRDAVGRALVPMHVVPHGDGPLVGRIVSDRLGQLRLSSVEAGAQRVSRTREHIARSPEAFVAAHVQVAGTATFLQDGRSTVVDAGELLVYDTSRPYTLDFPEPFAGRVAHLPRHALNLPDADLGRISGTAISTAEGIGAVFMPFLASLIASAHSYAPPIAERLAAGVVDLFATLVTERVTRDSADSARGDLLRRIRDHIDRNLQDPALSPETVAAAQHISVRYLHRLFEGEGITVGRLIQRRRLEECARDLTRGGGPGPSVSAVAHRWGFVNSAHFSRSFRGAYGHSPREWRALRMAAS